jgi:hypothetical protein
MVRSVLDNRASPVLGKAGFPRVELNPSENQEATTGCGTPVLYIVPLAANPVCPIKTGLKNESLSLGLMRHDETPGLGMIRIDDVGTDLPPDYCTLTGF